MEALQDIRTREARSAASKQRMRDQTDFNVVQEEAKKHRAQAAAQIKLDNGPAVELVPRSVDQRRRSASQPMESSKWEVLSKGGLRIREQPDANAAQVGKLPFGAVVTALRKKGNWIEHSQGWSMISDGQRDGKMFLKPLFVEQKHRPADHSGDHFQIQVEGAPVGERGRGRSRDASRERASSRPRSKSRPREWLCVSCQFSNAPEMEECGNCRAVRPAAQVVVLSVGDKAPRDPRFDEI